MLPVWGGRNTGSALQQVREEEGMAPHAWWRERAAQKVVAQW